MNLPCSAVPERETKGILLEHQRPPHSKTGSAKWTKVQRDAGDESLATGDSMSSARQADAWRIAKTRARRPTSSGIDVAGQRVGMHDAHCFTDHVTVLVVEDDEEMRALLKAFLQHEGYRVIEEGRGDRAQLLVESERLDAAIVDKEIPGLDGLELLSLLRRRRPEVPVILITAFGGPAVAEEAMRRGARYYVEKPFRVTKILEAVDGLITRPDERAR
jgi:CheY-like chemotaxis protein